MVRVWKLGLALLLASTAWGVQAEEDSVCALVKIEIKQELTLERQGFEAIMQINNALPEKSLTNVEVKVNFTNAAGDTVLASSDPNSKEAAFFIRQAEISDISAVDGTGELAAGKSARIRWLIIPAPGTAGEQEAGTLYLVGATLNYKLDGVASTLDVAPDTIYVKPMPQLSLDYFLPAEVVGDDAFTDAIEPPVPFSLGVRVRNNGNGVARKVKIDSAQPKIVENNQGLLINFELLGSWMGNQAVNNSLLIDFGDIARASAAVGRWVMQVSLSGHFSEFKAEFRHADELGGQLTSLIKEATTHTLIQDVLLDEPGRDDKLDFLATDAGVYTLYESAGQDLPVADLSNQATLNPQGVNRYQLTLPATEGPHLVVLTDPYGGQKSLKRVVRSDGKIIKASNAWLNPHRELKQKVWQYQLSLFDHHSTGQYTLEFADKVAIPQAPVLQVISNKVGFEGGHLGFLVEASDPNGDAVNFSAVPLPTGATLKAVAGKPNQAEFGWVPAAGQAGTYALTFTASDGTLYANRTVSIRINPANDKDGDGMDDAWELAHFKTLDRDGTGDLDGDGISDLDEFKGETDPTLGEPPRAPEPVSPLTGRVNLSSIPLVVKNSVYLGKEPLTYFFEIYRDAAMSDKVAESGAVAQGKDQTSWTPAIEWQENRHYYWRVRAHDKTLYSLWREAEFVRDVSNEVPSGLALQAPAPGSALSDKQPALSVKAASDPDGDEVSYQFFIYGDTARSQLLASSPRLVGSEAVVSWQPEQLLSAGKRYDWRVVASDGRGLSQTLDSGWFTIVPDNGLPSAPAEPVPAIGSEIIGSDSVTLQVAKATDPEGDALSYQFQLAASPDFAEASLRSSEWLSADAQGMVSWQADKLVDGHYYWRVRAKDSRQGEGPWLTGDFKLLVVPPAPATPTIRNPGHQAWVESLTPRLEVVPVTGKSEYRYRFELFSDAAGVVAVESGEVSEPYWQPKGTLQDNSWYYWRVTALDSRFNQSSQPSALQAFFVNNQGLNDKPSLSWLAPMKSLTLMQGESLPLRWQAFDPDSEARVSLYAWSIDGGAIWDNEGPGFSVTGSGWKSLNNTVGFIGATMQQAPVVAGVESRAQWQMTVPTPGYYQVQVRQRASDAARYVVLTQQKSGEWARKEYEKAVSSPSPQASWLTLDVVPVMQGNITLQLVPGKRSKALLADAVRLVPVATSEQLVVAGLPEQSAEASYEWQAIPVLPGNYKLAAVIEDEVSREVVVATSTLQLAPRPTLLLDNSQAELVTPEWSKVSSELAQAGDYLKIAGLPRRIDPAPLDSDTQGESVQKSGRWIWTTQGSGFQGSGYWVTPRASPVQSLMVWKLVVPESGVYQLQASWPVMTGAAPDATYLITLASGETITVTKDQRQSQGWDQLLRRELPAGPLTVTLKNAVRGLALADAVRLVDGRDFPRVQWSFKVESSGWYRLDSRWVALATSAPRVDYHLSSGKLNRLFSVDQRQGGGAWQALGGVYLEAGVSNLLDLVAQGDGDITADALRLVALPTLRRDAATPAIGLMDNSDSGFLAIGSWSSDTQPSGFTGSDYLQHASGMGEASARWHFAVPEAGDYKLSVSVPVSTNSGTRVPYLVESGMAKSTTVLVDPSKANSGWVTLGTFTLENGMAGVTLSNKANGYVAADALRVERVK